tara:strand:- start:1226 stop:1582 length:357 start_codon:yes stop_codon:yes gene_type:complete
MKLFKDIFLILIKMYEVYDDKFEMMIENNNKNMSAILFYMFMLFSTFMFFLSKHTTILTNEIIELNRQLKVSQKLNNLTELEESDSSSDSVSSCVSESDDEETYNCGNDTYVYSNHSN